MIRSGWPAALSIVLLLFVSMATPGAAQQPPIKIGVVGGLSGAAASIGQAWADAIKMGADEINAGGGILGRKVALSLPPGAGRVGSSLGVPGAPGGLVSRVNVKVAMLPFVPD